MKNPTLARFAAAVLSMVTERPLRPRDRRWRSLAVLLVGAALVACSSTAPVPTPIPDPKPRTDLRPPVAYVLSLTPASDVVLVGTIVEFLATIVPGYDGELVWTTSAGSVVADGHRASVTMPEAAGLVEVSVALVAAPERRADAQLEVRTGLTEAFMIAMLPDTQNMLQAEAEPSVAAMAVAMIDWIVAEREARNIEFVTHVGDVVSWADDDVDWSRARDALDRLDGVVPYSVAVGDHEYFPEEYKEGSVAKYLANFGPQRYADYAWYLGSHEDGLSHLQTFTGGGRTFLHLAVEWAPLGSIDDPSSPLGWARAQLEANPGVPTIITTHAYLWDRPGREGYFDLGGREAYVYADDGTTKVLVGPSGRDLFDALVESFPQVFMVLGGHFHEADGRFHEVSTNADGLEVYEMLANFQSWPNGGDGWMRTIEFLPAGGANGLDRIAVETYSPARERAGLGSSQTDAAGRFHFDLDFAARFDLVD